MLGQSHSATSGVTSAGSALADAALLPTFTTEQRRYARREFRNSAAVTLESSLPAFPRDGQRHLTLTIDISRGGTCFLFPSELYPSETGMLDIAGVGEKRFAIVRCRRLTSKCFQIGARFIAKAEPASE
jgi:hypothetical protein